MPPPRSKKRAALPSWIRHISPAYSAKDGLPVTQEESILRHWSWRTYVQEPLEKLHQNAWRRALLESSSLVVGGMEQGPPLETQQEDLDLPAQWQAICWRPPTSTSGSSSKHPDSHKHLSVTMVNNPQCSIDRESLWIHTGILIKEKRQDSIVLHLPNLSASQTWATESAWLSDLVEVLLLQGLKQQPNPGITHALDRRKVRTTHVTALFRQWASGIKGDIVLLVHALHKKDSNKYAPIFWTWCVAQKMVHQVPLSVMAGTSDSHYSLAAREGTEWIHVERIAMDYETQVKACLYNDLMESLPHLVPPKSSFVAESEVWKSSIAKSWKHLEDWWRTWFAQAPGRWVPFAVMNHDIGTSSTQIDGLTDWFATFAACKEDLWGFTDKSLSGKDALDDYRRNFPSCDADRKTVMEGIRRLGQVLKNPCPASQQKIGTISLSKASDIRQLLDFLGWIRHFIAKPLNSLDHSPSSPNRNARETGGSKKRSRNEMEQKENKTMLWAMECQDKVERLIVLVHMCSKELDELPKSATLEDWKVEGLATLLGDLQDHLWARADELFTKIHKSNPLQPPPSDEPFMLSGQEPVLHRLEIADALANPSPDSGQVAMGRVLQILHEALANCTGLERTEWFHAFSQRLGSHVPLEQRLEWFAVAVSTLQTLGLVRPTPRKAKRKEGKSTIWYERVGIVWCNPP